MYNITGREYCDITWFIYGCIFPIGKNKMTRSANMNPQSIKEPKDIGAIIRNARKRVKLTQAEAAAMCSVGTRFLSDLENGKSSLHLGKALLVLKAFGLRVLIKQKEFSDE